MKIIVSSSVLKRAVGFVLAIVKNNPIVPILENILFTLENGFLTLRTSDLRITSTTVIAVDAGIESGSFVLPAVKLSQLLNTLPEGPLTITVNNENYGHTIKWESGKSKLTGENPVDFPKLTELSKDSVTISLDENGRHTFVNALNSVAWGVSKDDLRPAMTGVYLHSSPDSLMLVATNGHHVLRQPVVLPDADQVRSIIIPAVFARMLQKISNTADKSYGLELAMSSANVRVQIGDDTLISRLIDERFPDYQNAIPTDNPLLITVNRQALIDALVRVNLTADNQARVKLSLSKGKLNLHTEDLDYNLESDETLPIEYDQEDFVIGFNGSNLLKVISHIDAEALNISLKAKNTGAMFWGDDEAASWLLMPAMLLGNY